MRSKYILERWDHGWLLCPPATSNGVPVTALQEVMPLMAAGAVMNTGIAHHYSASGKRVTFCMGDPEELKKWESDIKVSLAGCDPQEQWWRGVDVGTSSAAMFAALTTSPFKDAAEEFGRGSTPHDAGDLGRCLGLLRLFPEWKARLPEVAEAYPDTKWPGIVENWETLESAEPREQRRILDEIPDLSGPDL